MSARILVVGSLNMDLVIDVPACPRPGETVIGGALQRHHGGKGANQAVAAARAGAVTAMCGCVGGDPFGEELLSALAAEDVDVRGVSRASGPSGVALITVGRNGENAIVVSPGANGELSVDRLGEEPIRGTALVCAQLEVPLPTVVEALKRARASGARTLLNAAPARPLPDDVLRLIDVLVVNELEAGVIASHANPGPVESARELVGRGVGACVVTLGARGLVFADPARTGRVGAYPVEVVDTTAAGDAFCGALAAAIVEGRSFEASLGFASAAGALAVTVRGARPSLPRRAAIDALVTG